MDRIALHPAKSNASLRAPIRTLIRAYASAIALIAARRALARSRAQLKDMPPHRLHDIGLTSDAAAQEASRPVWDAPDHWLRK